MYIDDVGNYTSFMDSMALLLFLVEGIREFVSKMRKKSTAIKKQKFQPTFGIEPFW